MLEWISEFKKEFTALGYGDLEQHPVLFDVAMYLSELHYKNGHTALYAATSIDGYLRAHNLEAK